MVQVALPRASRHPFFLFTVAVAPLCLAALSAVAFVAWRYGPYERVFGWSTVASSNGLLVIEVEPGGAADGRLTVGDRIAGVSSGVIPPVGFHRRAAPLDRPYTVHMAEGRSVVLQPPTVRAGRLGGIGAVFLCAAVYVAVGLLLGFARPELRNARLLSTGFIAVGLLQLQSVIYSFVDQLSGVEHLIPIALSPFTGTANAMILYAAVCFPGPRVPRLLWPWFGILVFGLAAADVATYAVPSAMLWSIDIDSAARLLFQWTPWFAVGPVFRTATELTAALGILGALAWKLALVTSPEDRRRLRWMFAGCIAATLPFFVYKVAQALSSNDAALRDSALRVFANSGIAIAPISVAYAVARHRVLDISVVIRRGLQYLLARNALTIVLLLPVIGLVYRIVLNRHRTIAEVLFANPTALLLIAATIATLRFRGVLRQRLDRMFFRESYDREHILRALIDTMDRLDSSAELAALSGTEVDRALHPSQIYICMRERDSTMLTLTHSSAARPAFAIPNDSRLLVQLERDRQIIERRDVDQSTREQWLEALDVELLVPIVGAGRRLWGVLMLGEKKSEEPYDDHDRELLGLVGKQLAIAHENLKLKERVDAERKVRDEVVRRLEGRGVNLVRECPRCGACYDGVTELCEIDGAELTIALPVERVVDDQYRLDRLIGKGGMGAVYQAQDLRLQRDVAIKFLLGHAFGEPTALRRFEREARACARLNHPNVVTVFDYGLLPANGAYLVMERLQGTTLRDELDRTGRLQPITAAKMLDQILGGIGAAHDAGIVHRDLKPENVFIVRASDRIKLLDFGLAQLRAVEGTPTVTVTAAGVLAGTLAYMAPEQLTNATMDERADLFAVGVIAVELLTGHRPFNRATYFEALTSMQSPEFDLSALGPRSNELKAVLLQCLAVDPAARWSSATELRAALIPALRRLAITGA
jgi:hypothetical protein